MPPSSATPTSKEIRVRVEGFSKTSATLRPASESAPTPLARGPLSARRARSSSLPSSNPPSSSPVRKSPLVKRRILRAWSSRHLLEPLPRPRRAARPGAPHLALAPAALRRAQRDPRPGQPRPDRRVRRAARRRRWDVALLQECPPRFAEPLARACGAEAHRVLTSRNSLARCAALLARQNPDLMASGEGGSNLTLVRAPGQLGGIAERREMAIHEGEPERRAMAFDPHRLRRLRRQPARDQRPTAAGGRGRAAAAAGRDRVGRRRAAALRRRPQPAPGRAPEVFERLPSGSAWRRPPAAGDRPPARPRARGGRGADAWPPERRELPLDGLGPAPLRPRSGRGGVRNAPSPWN